jgi:ribosomal protein L37E
MAFRGKKVYGESRKNVCAFCGDTSISTNSQGVPVCKAHKNELLLDLKCICGEWVDIKLGKYGPFFICMKCGPQSFNKILELNGYPLKSVDSL